MFMVGDKANLYSALPVSLAHFALADLVENGRKQNWVACFLLAFDSHIAAWHHGSLWVQR